MAPALSIPDDIIQLIVDEVANSQDLPTLRTCALVSWAVNVHARKHLFSNIHFLLDSSANCNKRAKRLVRLLRHSRNQYLRTHIRALTIVVGDRPADNFGTQRSPTSLRKVIANLVSPRVDYISILLQLFASIPLIAFTLTPRLDMKDLNQHSQTVFIVHWPALLKTLPGPTSNLSGLIHNIACKPGIQALTFRWVWGMPVSLLVGGGSSTSLRRLNIHRSSFEVPEQGISADDSSRFTNRVSHLTALKLISHAPLLRFISLARYPSLTTVAVSIPSQTDELARRLQLLLTTSSTLVSLAVQCLASHGGTTFTSLTTDDYLSNFASLEQLKYTAGLAGITLTPISDISRLLQSARKPLHLKTIAIHFHVYYSRSQTWIWDFIHSGRAENFEPAAVCWADLDRALANNNLGQLRRVCIHFTFFVYRQLSEPTRPSLEWALPAIYSRPLVKVEVTSERIEGRPAHEMWARGSNDEGQSDDENFFWQP